jgi:hypothetical protein
VADDLLELETPELEAEEPETSATTEGEETTDTEKTKEWTEDEKLPAATSLFQPDGRKLDPAVKAGLAKLKAESPDVAKLVTKALYDTAQFNREFPGGLPEVLELRKSIDGLGGLPAIQEKIEVAAELGGLAEAFDKADPAFVEDMIVSNLQAFSNLCPTIINRYADVHPAAFKQYIGNLITSDLTRAGIPLAMMRLADVITDNPKAIPLYNQIVGYLENFRTFAEAKVEPLESKPKEVNENQTAQREADLRSKEWKLDRDSLQKRITNEEYSKILAGRKPTSEEKAQITELYLSRSAKLANKYFPNWQTKSQQLIKSGDKAGYLKFITTIYRRVVPEAMSSAVAGTLKSGRPVAAAVTTVKQEPLVNRQQNGQFDGFQRVSKEPDTWEIDYGRTDSRSLRGNKAYLLNGKKVTWQ